MNNHDNTTTTTTPDSFLLGLDPDEFKDPAVAIAIAAFGAAVERENATHQLELDRIERGLDDLRGDLAGIRNDLAGIREGVAELRRDTDGLLGDFRTTARDIAAAM